MDSSIQEQLNSLSSEYFDSHVMTSNGIYFDMTLLQDFKMGALLCLITVEEEYKYIMHRLPYYNSNRLDREIMKHFPVLKHITEDDIDNFINDLSNAVRLTTISPMTSLYYDVVNIVQGEFGLNDKSHKDINTFNIFVNFPKFYPEAFVAPIISNLSSLDRKINVNYSNDEFYSAIDDVNKYDLYFVEDITRIINSKENTEFLFEEQRFLDKRIVSPPILANEERKDISINEMFENTKRVLSVMCKFDYLIVETVLNSG